MFVLGPENGNQKITLKNDSCHQTPASGLPQLTLSNGKRSLQSAHGNTGSQRTFSLRATVRMMRDSVPQSGLAVRSSCAVRGVKDMLQQIVRSESGDNRARSAKKWAWTTVRRAIMDLRDGTSSRAALESRA
jgi:hypothetical protein